MCARAHDFSSMLANGIHVNTILFAADQILVKLNRRKSQAIYKLYDIINEYNVKIKINCIERKRTYVPTPCQILKDMNE